MFQEYNTLKLLAMQESPKTSFHSWCLAEKKACGIPWKIAWSSLYRQIAPSPCLPWLEQIGPNQSLSSQDLWGLWRREWSSLFPSSPVHPLTPVKVSDLLHTDLCHNFLMDIPQIQHLIFTVAQLPLLRYNFHPISHPQNLSKGHFLLVSHMNIFWIVVTVTS